MTTTPTTTPPVDGARDVVLDGEPNVQRFGHFLVLGTLGQGGMGMVLEAFDRTLDRRVAVKILHGDFSQSSKRRLVREAKALAQLSHPNVVQVYEVGEVQGKAFVAMELARGRTLDAWLGTVPPPSWRERLDAYLQAGEGLAAAHAEGLVHRDFKPANVLIDDEGHVRVVDFGLARRSLEGSASREEEAPLPSSEDSVDARVTQAGERVGTPAYMSPEQRHGREIDARSDQFSFCVSLYEALYGERPFAGSSLHQLLSAIAQRSIRPPPAGSHVPARLRRIVVRGLSARPDERWPSMDALLAELGRDPARARRRIFTASAFAGVLGTAIYALATQAPSQTAADLCQVAEDELSDVWNDARRTSVARALEASSRPYADKARPQVEAALDRYGDSWAQTRERACIDHERGGDSSEVYDRRITCLTRRRRALDRGITLVAEVAAASPERAVDIVRGLPRVEDCSDATLLRSALAPPRDENTKRAVEQQRQRLDEVELQWDAGQGTAALALAEEVADEARALEYLPLVAEAELTQGRIAMKTDVPASEVAASLLRAGLAAWETGQDELAIEAAARYIYVVGTTTRGRSASQGGFAPDLELMMKIAEAQALGAPDHPFARALLYNNLASAQRAILQVDPARAYYRRALNELADVSNAPPELDHVLSNLAQITPDPTERSRLFEEAMRRFDAAYGAEHPEALAVRLDYSHYLADPARVREILEPVCSAYERYHPDLIEQRHTCSGRLAFVLAELGERAEAAALLDRVASAPASGDQTRDRRLSAALLAGHAHRYRGDPAEAIASLEWVTANLSSELWWERFVYGQAALGLGEALHQHGELPAAVAALERAVDALDDYCEGAVTQNVKGQQWRAAAQATLAVALVQAGGSRDRAAQLASSAATFYRAAGPGYRWRLDGIERWRREQGL